MEKPLSNTDIERKLNNKTRVIKYNELRNFSTIEQLLYPYGNAIILYPTGVDIGHWTCVVYSYNSKGEKIIEFFDPYGISVDNEFKYSAKKCPHYLAYLLYQTPYKIEYNDNKLQKFCKNISTCGRHVINRVLNKDIPLKDYNKLYGNSKGVSADELVTILTSL